MMQRTKIRKRFHIKGSPFRDCVESVCCTCCVLVQHEKQSQVQTNNQEGYNSVTQMAYPGNQRTWATLSSVLCGWLFRTENMIDAFSWTNNIGMIVNSLTGLIFQGLKIMFIHELIYHKIPNTLKPWLCRPTVESGSIRFQTCPW
jgi:hypothetical protein